MILTRSPFYNNQVHPNNYITSVDFNIKIGTGPTNSMNVIEEYSITKQKPSSSTTNTFIDLSPYIRTFFKFEPMLLSGSSVIVNQSTNDSVMLVECEASFKDTLGSNEDNVTTSYIATDGYGSYTGGQNFQPTKKILLTHTEYKADYRGYFIVPLQCDSDDANPTVNGVEVSLNFIERSYQRVKYLQIPCANYSGTITVAFEGETITIELIEECKYDVNEVQFLNRYGVFEVIHFYKIKKDSLSFNFDSFKNNYTTGTGYDQDRHQIKRMNVQGNKTFNVETGFLNEAYNGTIEELMMSEHVWANRLPVNVVSKSLDLKTRIVDKLISYSLDFEYAFDQISNV